MCGLFLKYFFLLLYLTKNANDMHPLFKLYIFLNYFALDETCLCQLFVLVRVASMRIK